MADTQKVPLQFLKESESKPVDGKGVRPNVLAFFNKKLDINRFFIEDSEGNNVAQQNAAGDVPKVETGGGMANGDDAGTDPFEDALDDALCVYVTGDETQDFIHKNEKLIMFYVDLENEEIVDKQAG